MKAAANRKDGPCHLNVLAMEASRPGSRQVSCLDPGIIVQVLHALGMGDDPVLPSAPALPPLYWLKKHASPEAPSSPRSLFGGAALKASTCVAVSWRLPLPLTPQLQSRG